MSQRFDYLDSSRGLAALSVLLSHFFGAYGLLPFLRNYENSIVHFLWHGEGAVTYFYVLSGYVLSIGFFQRKIDVNHFSITSFVIRRIFRIFPLFLACLCISFILLKAYSEYSEIVISPVRSNWILALWSAPKTFIQLLKESLLVVSIPSDSSLRLIPQDWTLKIELIYSSIVPIAILLLLRGRAWLVVFFVFLMLLGNSFFFAFVLGILIAFYNDIISVQFGRLNIFFVIMILLAGLLLYTVSFGFLNFFVVDHSIRVFMLESTGSAILLICLIGNKFMRNILSNKILTFLGRISYGIYLTHLFILIAFIPLVLKFLNQHGIVDNQARLISLLCLILTTVAVSFITFKVVEKPFNDLGKTLALKYFRD